MKRITLILLAAAAIIAGSVSCSKVNDIDKRLTQLEQTVSDLKAQVLAGAVITSVEKTEGGCTFTLSNGQSYIVTNGKNGTDGEAIIADVKIEEDFVVLTLKNGEILRISYQNPLSMVTLNIVPDYDDGTVREPKTTETMGTKSHNFYLDVAVTPAKYAEILADTERFIHKAVFSPVQTKSDFGNAFTAIPKGVTYMAGAPVPFLQASFDLDDETAALLQSSAYTVSYSIEDKDGVHGAATAFVAISHKIGSGEDGPNIEDDIFGQGEASVNESAGIEGNKVKWIQLWKNGPKFAEYNVGVTDGKAESYGGYYCWGNAVDKDITGTFNRGNTPLIGNDDIAACLWGENWRMPTIEEFNKLLENCDVEWTVFNGKNGRKFTGKDNYSYNSVFFPIAGYCYYGNVYDQKQGGVYWSSTPNGSEYSYNLSFASDIQVTFYSNRYYGYSVRAVLAE